MSAILCIEGQEYQVDDEIANGGATVAASDQFLRDALRPTFEIAAGATFVREQRDGLQRITLVKNPGPKGSAHILRVLLDAPEWVNPIVDLACEMHVLESRDALTIDVVDALRERVELALKQGQKEDARISATLSLLRRAPAIAATNVPAGL